jgi:transposase-like protein
MDTETQDLRSLKSKMQKKRQSYTLEFKLKAVELGKGRGKTLQAAQELGTSVENIRRWKNQLDDGILGS